MNTTVIYKDRRGEIFPHTIPSPIIEDGVITISLISEDGSVVVENLELTDVIKIIWEPTLGE